LAKPARSINQAALVLTLPSTPGHTGGDPIAAVRGAQRVEPVAIGAPGS